MATKLRFTKMHGFGNDFAIFDLRTENADFQFTNSDLIITGDRNFGIGCDQLITIHKSEMPEDEKSVTVAIKVYNQDGTEAKNCGNGIRCIVGYIARETAKPVIRVQLGGKNYLGKADKEKGVAKVNMGVPTVDGEIVELGNRHKINIVQNFDNINRTPDPEFNVHYVQVRARDDIFVRSIERGAGETMCCGSGACACAAYCITKGLTDKVMKVFTRGSDIMGDSLQVNWDGEGKPMLLGGGYTFVFTGEIEI